MARKDLKPPFNQLTPEEHQIIASKGGKKSGEVRKAKKTFKEIAEQLLNCDAPENIKAKIKKVAPDLSDEQIDVRLAIMQKQIIKALNGDNKSFELVRDTVGEKPVEKHELVTPAQKDAVHELLDGALFNEQNTGN